jgi:hypothetical protein
MRTVPSDVLTAMTHVRTPSSSVIIRDKRLRFANSVSRPGPAYLSYDADLFTYNSTLRLLRAWVSTSGYLCYQVITDPTTTWPTYITSSETVDPGTMIGVYANRIFFIIPTTHEMKYSDVIWTTSWVLDSSVHSLVYFTGMTSVALAPVLGGYVYYLYKQTGNNYGKIGRLFITDHSTVEWPGRVYDTAATFQAFDAESSTEGDYIYYEDKTDTRPWYLIGSYGAGGLGLWSDPKPVLPIDVLEDSATFKMGKVSNISSSLFVSGIYDSHLRSTHLPMHIYTMGPAPHTMGRDKFISSEQRTQPGKLHVMGNVCYYVTPDYSWAAPATNLVLYDSEALKATVTGIGNVHFAQSTNNSGDFSFTLPNSYTHAALRTGSEVEWWAAYGGHEVLMGVFGIDSIQNSRDPLGQAQTVTCRSLAMKTLAMWQSDASYDNWSQTKQSCNPAAMDELIRTSGTWDGDPLTLTELNQSGVLYSSAMAVKNSLVRAKFKMASGDSSALYGLFLNYAQETYAAAWTRLGHEPSDNEYTYTGLAVIYGTQVGDTPRPWSWPEVPGGTQGIGVWTVAGGIWTRIDSAALTIPCDLDHWLQAEFHDGQLIVRYRLDTDTTWTTVGLTTSLINNPWPVDDRGRGGIYVRNVTPNTTCYGFTSDSTIIPVLSVAGISSFPEIVLVDSEQIQVTSKSSGTGGYIVNKGSGVTFPNATHNNPYWTVGETLSQNIAQANDQKICDITSNKFVCRAVDLLETTTIHSVKFQIKKTGSPTTPLYCWLVTDKFDGAAPLAAKVLAVTSVAAASISTSYGWIEFVFADPVELAGAYHFALTDVALAGIGSPVIDPVNYYTLGTNDSLAPDELGIIRIYGPAVWYTLETAVPTILYGISNKAAGYEIYLDDATLPAVDRNYFDDMALVVIGGPGQGSVFRITDYDLYAPFQWVPNRAYHSPDTWQNHVGDVAHGSWQYVANTKRVFVDTDPSSTIGDGSIFRIMPAYTCIRGYGDTDATTHEDGIMSVYRTPLLSSSTFEYFSAEKDFTLLDMATEIARKSGIIMVVSDKKVNSVAYACTGMANWYTDATNTHQDVRNLILRFARTAGTEVGVVFHRTSVTPFIGHAITVSDSYLSLYTITAETTLTLTERIPLVMPTTANYFTLSVQDNIFSVWQGSRFLHSFVGAQPAYLTVPMTAGFIGASGSSILVDWDELDLRVDNFIMDNGKTGNQLMQRLIGEKHVYYQDTQDGYLRIYRNYPVITDTLNLVVLSDANTNESELATRIRIEGAGIAETYNTTKLRDEGDLFLDMNMNELNTDGEALIESQFLLDELARRTCILPITGAADPRIEPGDTITIAMPSPTPTSGGFPLILTSGSVSTPRTVVVDSINMTMAIDLNQVVFDMTLEAYDEN